MKIFILAALVEDRKVTAITMMVWSSAIAAVETRPEESWEFSQLLMFARSELSNGIFPDSMGAE